ncbi:phosphohydrolase [Geobacter sp. DSM 9736]|uniref:phosphohydrolase n=1 Tax=Geobacter sp. DSM 9736 TaxID=1277350 RepID=UPI000B5045BD|nr:phosphohydrolase [Geobacter sp. DSM 9736]SNB45538.1 hypothetical protein SAMN06269301_0956 [Geobacter sp. DSM 9736]
MKEVFLTIALAGGGLLIYSVANMLNRTGNLPSAQDIPQGEPEEVKLSDVSEMWAGEVFHIQNLSELWRKAKARKCPPLPRPAFKHQEIDRFYAEMVENEVAIEGARRSVIVQLLQMLDEEGDCPSVVRMNPLEAEAKLTDDTFAMLATIPLYQHTLNVARRCAAKIGQDFMLADFMIVSLAHDLGKIPSHQNKMYTSGDHPLLSALIVNGITEYASLPSRTDLDKIIKGHHLLKTDSALTDMLKQCDHDARQQELATLLVEAKERNRQQKPEYLQAGIQNPAGANTVTVMPKLQKVPPGEEREHPVGETVAKENFHPVTQALPVWFDADAILGALKKRINRLDTTAEGQRWDAVSTGSGIVYAQPEGVWAAIREISGNDPAILASDANEEAKRNLLFTVIWELSRTRDAIAKELITPQYYTTQVTVLTGSGKGYTAFLIPFRAETFAETVSALEELKPPLLKKMVKDIRPKLKETEKCVI